MCVFCGKGNSGVIYETKQNTTGLTEMSLQTGEALFVGFIGLLLLFSIISNVLVIAVVIKYPRMRNISNICICNLAVSEILLAGFVLPQNLHDISHTENYYEGKTICSIVNFAPLFCIMVSIYSLVALSFERRRAILLCKEQRPMTVLRILIPAIWVGSFCVCIPTIFEYSQFSDFSMALNRTDVHCGSTKSTTYSVVNALMLICISYIVPLVLIITNCVVVVRFIWKSGKDAAVTQQRRIVAARKMRIIHMLVIATALFAVSWAPYFTLLTVGKVIGLDSAEMSGGPVNLVRIALSAFSATYNIFLYVIYNSNFRDGFKAMFSNVKCVSFTTPIRVGPSDNN